MERVEQIFKMRIKFLKDLETKTQNLSPDERLDILDALIEAVQMYQNKLDGEEISKFLEANLYLKYRHKLKEFYDAQVDGYLFQSSYKFKELQSELGIEASNNG